MIDCGEGAQLGLRRSGLGFRGLNNILITHLHGDHCFGLPGLLSTLGLLGRTKPLAIYGPTGIGNYVSGFIAEFGQGFPYEVEVREFDAEVHVAIIESRKFRVYTLPLNHSVPTAGFLVEEICQPRHIIKEELAKYDIPLSTCPAILKGEDYIMPDGVRIPNSQLTRLGRRPIRYAYCSDTAYHEGLVKLVEGVDLLYHEATFLEGDSTRGGVTFHSTARDAATIAKRAQVKRLLIGHYSSRYLNERELLHEARSVFPETFLADEGMRIGL